MTLARLTISEPVITDFAELRNQKLAAVKADWVLFLDKDERLSPALEREIDAAIKNPRYAAYYLKRRDTFLGRELRHGEPGRAKFIRLARRDFGHWERPVHEVWVGTGRVGTLKHPLLHSPHPSVADFLHKIDYYSSLESHYRYNLGQSSSLFKILVYPPAKFLLNYIFYLGFLDGTPGIIMAFMMSFHSYLTWTKLYLLWHKK